MELQTLRGSDTAACLDALARLRIQVFAEWPYLYRGDAANEASYLAAFAASASAVLVVARDGERIVGVSSAMALVDEAEPLRQPLVQAGYDAAEWYYLAESVLLPEYRGRGLGHRFFDEREAAGAALGFRRFAFCAVVRDADDPRRPPEHRELHAFWTARGYQPSAVHAVLDWPEVGGEAPVSHRLRFWLREA